MAVAATFENSPAANNESSATATSHAAVRQLATRFPCPICMSKKRKGREIGFLRRHSLSIVSCAILLSWILLYRVSNPQTHWGSFFGNAIADWTGLVVMVFATKHLYERGSQESKQPPPGGFLPGALRHLRDHSLSIFLFLTGAIWIGLFVRSDPQGKWGQVVSNIVSEWSQILGLVLLTKRLIEWHSKESKR